jgi:hypothetical protein
MKHLKLFEAHQSEFWVRIGSDTYTEDIFGQFGAFTFRVEEAVESAIYNWESFTSEDVKQILSYFPSYHYLFLPIPNIWKYRYPDLCELIPDKSRLLIHLSSDNVMDEHDIEQRYRIATISKLKDEWYYVCDEVYRDRFKCDQISGLLDLLKNRFKVTR